MYRYLHRLWPSSSTSLHATRLMNSYLKGQRRRLEKLLIIIAVESVCRAHTSIVQFTYSSVAGLTEISWLSSVYVELFLFLSGMTLRNDEILNICLGHSLAFFFYQYSHTKTIQFIKHFFAFLFRIVRDWLKHCVEFSISDTFFHISEMLNIFWISRPPKLLFFGHKKCQN